MSRRLSPEELTLGVIDAQYRLVVLERLLEAVLPHCAPGVVTPDLLERVRSEALTIVRNTYPGVEVHRPPTSPPA